MLSTLKLKQIWSIEHITRVRFYSEGKVWEICHSENWNQGNVEKSKRWNIEEILKKSRGNLLVRKRRDPDPFFGANGA